MNIVVINGTEKKGVTYNIKELFLENFKNEANIREFYLPKDCPNFCAGCTLCFKKSELLCKDVRYVQEIEKAIIESDLVIFTSPVYVYHCTGAMKTLLDHLGYRWMIHRPAKEMFGKRALIITQCVGGGAKTAAKDIKDSLSWWGISRINVFTAKLMNELLWDKLSDDKKKHITKKIKKVSNKLSRVDYSKPARTKFMIKVKFNICRKIQKSIQAKNPDSVDYKYWEENGWLKTNRPWKF